MVHIPLILPVAFVPETCTKCLFQVCMHLCVSRSVVPDSLQPHGLQYTRFLCPGDFPGKDTGVGCHFL